MAQIFVNPLEDSGFKILFRKKRNMVRLLEAILDRKIDDLEYIDTEQLGVTIDENKSRFDLAVRFSDGSDCVVEMQRACLQYFNYRAVFYASHLVQRQANAEHDRQFQHLKSQNRNPFWNYRFSPVYFVGILENGWGEIDNLPGALVEYYRLKEVSSGKDMKVDYNFIFLRLDRFSKSEQECETILDKFAYSLKNMGKEEFIPASFSEDSLKELYNDALIANLSADLAHELILSGIMTTENDWLVAISEAEERAIARGIEKGLEQGLEQGLERGLEQGLERGKVEIMSIARKMKERGMCMEDICAITGLTEEQFK